MTTPTPIPITDRGLLRLLAWLSPSFPVGSYAYSHGAEFAVESG
ncbi:MAG: urease accessory protein UreF, partial [Rhodospirillales bacterium]|nr:urease accessory protein UreF [Rhodospirillales bacterium]